MLNVRISDEMEKKLKKYSMDQGVSKSDIVKEALVQYFSKKEASNSPFLLGADLFGQEGSGNANASQSYKIRLKEKLGEKHSH